jgi:hypothetical protein
MKTTVLIDFAAAYIRLSPAGRHWLRSRPKRKGVPRSGEEMDLIEDRGSRRELIEKLLISDRAFGEFVPDDILKIAGRPPDLVYRRFVPFAFFNLLIRGRLLEAFELAYDRAAETRLAALMFFMREWNDVREIHGLEAVFEAMRPLSNPSPSFSVLRRLFDATHEIAPEHQHPAYAALRKRWLEQRPGYVPADPSEARLQAAATVSLMGGYGIMLPEIPEILAGAVRPFGLWLYGLDALADLNRDRKAHSPTYFGGLADPIKEIRRLYGVCEEHFRRAARSPERILPLMKFLTDETVKAHETGFDLETEFFGAPPEGAIRTEDPSGSDTAAGT